MSTMASWLQNNEPVRVLFFIFFGFGLAFGVPPLRSTTTTSEYKKPLDRCPKIQSTTKFRFLMRRYLPSSIMYPVYNLEYLEGREGGAAAVGYRWSKGPILLGLSQAIVPCNVYLAKGFRDFFKIKLPTGHTQPVTAWTIRRAFSIGIWKPLSPPGLLTALPADKKLYFS